MAKVVKERRRDIDILKGIGILLMVFDHVSWGGVVHKYVQSFHMPLFFIVSGYLYKHENLDVVIKKRFKSLMIPYVCFSILYLIFRAIVISLNTDSILNDLLLNIRAVMLFPTDMEHMPYAPALWFLPCMFLTSVLYSIIDRVIRNNVAQGILICILAVMGAIYSAADRTMLPFCLEPLCLALLFFFVGRLFAQYRKLERIALDGRLSHLLSIGFVLIVLVHLNICVDMRSARYGNVVLYIVNSVLGTVLFWNVSRKIERLNKSKIIYFLSYFGVNSMAFVCMNQFWIGIGYLAKLWISPSSVLIEITVRFSIFIFTMLLCTAADKILEQTKMSFVLGKYRRCKENELFANSRVH